MNEIATVDRTTAVPVSAPPTRRPAEVRVVSDAIAVLDTGRFEHMQRIANVMAHMSLIPDALCAEGPKDDRAFLPIERVAANCFLVVNQSVRWNMDPFAVAQCVSVVHGKLCYEGKLIAAVIESKLGFDLEYEITGEGDNMKVVVSAATKDGKPVLNSKGQPKTVEGTVGEWKTTNSGSPWAARGGHQRMLRYRGAREWCRVHAPGLMLGVYSDDEMEDLNANHRANNARAIEEPPAPPAQIEQQTSLPVEELVTQKTEAPVVEWNEPEENNIEQSAATEEPPAPPKAAASDFPGDTPMKSANDDGLDIPPALKRDKDNKPAAAKTAKPKAEAVDEKEWLDSIENALTGVEGTAELAEVQSKYQAPMKGKVSKMTWAKSQTLIMDKFNELSEADSDDGDDGAETQA